MTLNKDQINSIKVWISKRGFTHSDVQYEILDHVATAIEFLMEKNPHLTLEEAFRLTHAEFGIFGFSEIEESVSKKFHKELFRSCFSGFKKILAGPTILIPLFLAILLVFISQHLSQYFYSIVYIILLSFNFVVLAIILKRYYSKKYLKNFLSFRIATGSVFFLTILPLNIITHIQNFNHPVGTIILLISFLFIEWSVLYGAKKMIRKSELLHQLYSELAH